MDRKTLLIYCILTTAIGIMVGCSNNNSGESNSNIQSDNNFYIYGCAQKGPFLNGSSVVIQELDSNLNSTGRSHHTTIENDIGDFSIQSEVHSDYVEIITTGFYYNEITGNLSEAQITLRSICEIPIENNTNVNVLTTIENQRLRYLMHNEDITFSQAKEQAKKEILAVFNIPEEGIHQFSYMNISGKSASDSALLAISSLLQSHHSCAELTEIISKIGLDLKEDGLIDKTSSHYVGIVNYSKEIDIIKIRNQLADRYSTIGLEVTIPHFGGYIDSDGDGLINRIDFTIGSEEITEAELSTEYISTEKVIVLPVNIEYAACTIDTGSIILNGIDTEKQMVDVKNGDKISVKLLSSEEYLTILESNISVKYLSYENKGIYSIKTKPLDIISIKEGPPWNKFMDSDGSFPIRYMHTAVIYNDKIWVLGGGYSYFNDGVSDVWYSEDGEEWVLKTDTADFSARNAPLALAFDNKIWLISGVESPFSGYRRLGDVWYSEDGEKWIRTTESIFEHSGELNIRGAIVFNDKMWVFNSDGRLYNSLNGSSWTHTTDSAPKGITSTVVLDHVIYVSTSNSGNIYSSTDGINWDKDESLSELKGELFSDDNRLWLLSTSFYSSKIINNNSVYVYNTDGWHLVAGTKKTNRGIWDALHFQSANFVTFDNSVYIIGTYGPSYNGNINSVNNNVYVLH